MEMKKCSNCKKYLSINNFINVNKKETKLCNKCKKEARNSYKKHREKILKKQKNIELKIKK